MGLKALMVGPLVEKLFFAASLGWYVSAPAETGDYAAFWSEVRLYQDKEDMNKSTPSGKSSSKKDSSFLGILYYILFCLIHVGCPEL